MKQSSVGDTRNQNADSQIMTKVEVPQENILQNLATCGCYETLFQQN